MPLARVGNPQLKLNKMHILNCFGMQPIFVSGNDEIDESFLSFVYRVGNVKNITGNMRSLIKLRRGAENDVIIKNKFHISNADRVVVDFFLNQRTFTYKQNASLDVLMQENNHKTLKNVILTQFKRIHYHTMMCPGNFIITSRRDLYVRRLFVATEVKDFNCYLVDESILPKNVLILGHSNINSFRTPYVACPLFDKDKFNELCYINGINIDKLKWEKDKEYPMIDKYLTLYSLYQSYLDNVDVPYWYIETFQVDGHEPIPRQKAYYTTLYFD